MRWFRLSFYLMMTIILLSGCEFKDVELVRVEGIDINKLEEGKLEGTITMVLSNPNAFPINIKSGTFNIYSGKVHMGDAQLAHPLRIQAGTTDTYEVEVKGTMGDVIAAGISSLVGLISGKQPEMIIKGELKAGYFFYSKTVPVELKTEMPLNL